jgi:hypothetical protein
MAWNPSAKVAAARDIGNKFGANKVIVIMINERAGIIESASYGETKAECAMAKRLADVAYDAVYEHIST